MAVIKLKRHQQSGFRSQHENVCVVVCQDVGQISAVDRWVLGTWLQAVYLQLTALAHIVLHTYYNPTPFTFLPPQFAKHKMRLVFSALPHLNRICLGFLHN